MDEKTVLFVDDEVQILNSLKRLLRREGYGMLTAESGAAALALLEKEPVQMVMSDQRMPEMTGVEFLKKVKELYPATVRVVLSGYADAGLIVDAINQGEIYRFLTKPWNDDDLKIGIRQCLEHYDILRENQAMTAQIRKQNDELRRLNEELEGIVDARTRSLQLSQDILEKLPIAVIGVSEEGWLVLMNQRVKETFPALRQVPSGTHVRNVFPSEAAQTLERILNNGNQPEMVTFDWDSRRVTMQVEPLKAGDAVRGHILIMEAAQQ
jgi:response regulator RpfG family c-di-GMP phosphodiesterase